MTDAMRAMVAEERREYHALRQQREEDARDRKRQSDRPFPSRCPTCGAKRWTVNIGTPCVACTLMEAGR